MAWKVAVPPEAQEPTGDVEALIALGDIAHEIRYGGTDADGLSGLGCIQFADRLEYVLAALTREPPKE